MNSDLTRFEVFTAIKIQVMTSAFANHATKCSNFTALHMRMYSLRQLIQIEY